MIQAEGALKKNGERVVDRVRPGEARLTMDNTARLGRAGLVGAIRGPSIQMSDEGMNSQREGSGRRKHHGLGLVAEVKFYLLSHSASQEGRLLWRCWGRKDRWGTPV